MNYRIIKSRIKNVDAPWLLQKRSKYGRNWVFVAQGKVPADVFGKIPSTGGLDETACFLIQTNEKQD